MNSESETLPNLQTVLDAVNNLQQETNKQFADLRQEMNAGFNQINLRLDEHDNRFEQMRLEMMSFDARLDRLQATAHENLNIAYNLRADVKILREEVSAWSKDIVNLQLKAA
jgi:methyl-accepting chemotaxis protein